MRLDVVRRLKPPASSTRLLLHAAWKYGLGVGIAAVVLTAGGVDRVQPNGHALASNVLPTTVPCGQIATDVGDPHTATWTALKSPYPGTASPYNLPVSTLNNTDPTVQPCDAIVVPPDVTLKIDASQGAVQIFSHGAAIKVDGGHLLVLGTSETNSVLFEAEPDVASWTGITIDAFDAAHRGNASFAFASIQHALNSIGITSGATSTPDPTDTTIPPRQLPYGLVLVNSGVGPSVFDGIDAADTPVSVKGRIDPLTLPLRADGKFGTVNNIGSQGIKFSWGVSAPAVTEYALKVDSVTFGSSVPFATTGCLPLQLPCSAGFIGNDAILATFTSPNSPPVLITQSRIYRAGSFGVELTAANRPVIKDNTFDCNGTSSPTPTQTCVGTGLKYSAVYLKDATVDLENSVTNNFGHEDGLDAIVLNGTIVYAPSVSQQVTWKNATNDPKNDHLLGYLLSGDLNINSGTLVVPAGSVVKSKGTINLTGAALNASDTSKPGTKVFTSLRDNFNIASCPSVFVQSCPSPLPTGEWGGINLVGSRTDATMRAATQGTITNAAIQYATTGVHILNGNSLTISGSTIGPTFADGVLAEGTPLTVTGTTFVPNSGNHGILADFRNSGPPGAGLKIGGNTFQGSVNEAIRAVGLAGQPVDIENNSIHNAGAAGSAGSAAIYLQGADNLTLQRNDVAVSGTGNVAYPAIWLDGVSHADFSGPISGNTGSGNGLNAIAFHGDTKTLAWQTVAPNGPLGFIVDGNLLVAGDLTLVSGDYAPVLAGTITVQTGKLTSSGAVLTSLKEQTANLLSCGSVFVPRISGVCSLQGPGDWGGLVLDPGMANQLTDSEIRYAVTGISVGVPTGPRMAQNLTMTRTNIRNTSSDGLSTQSPVSITGGAFTNNGGRGIKIDLTNTTPSAFQPVTITGHASVAGSGQDGILAVKLGGHTVQVQDVSVDRSGTYGINLKDANHLTLTNNTVINSGATFPAIYLNGFTGLFANISGNRGALNGVDALAFHGTVTDDLTWQTARKSGDPTRLLGYILDGTLTLQPGHTFTVNAGDIVKVGNGGLLNLQGVNLKADDTGVGSQKVFTSLTDDGVGVATCRSAVVIGCTGMVQPLPQPGDWGGIILAGSGANGTLVNAVVRYASTGILINSGASSTSASSVFGLVVSGSTVGPSAVDGINATMTPISVTTSSFSGGTHGISVDLTATTAGTPLRFSGNRFTSTSAEAILGQALGGQPVWITDNRIQGATTYGIRLLNADQLVLRNNNIAASGGGPGAGAGRYPAIYLPAVSADFTGNIRGNVGSGNGLDALVFDGNVTSDLTWIRPRNAGSTHALGYLLDGGLTLQGGKLVVGAGDVVKSLGGPITINGGNITASGLAGGSPTSNSAIFTSLKDNPGAPGAPPILTAADMSDAAAVSCPSVLVSDCNPHPGDWGGLAITANAAGVKGSGVITYGLIKYANTGISLDSGPISASLEPSNFRLTVASTTIANASKDGISSLDTPFSVKDSATIQNVGANGIIASFFSPANCSSTPPISSCVRLNITNVNVNGTGKDGIVANGLGGQPTIISNNTVTNAGTYGIRLIGADQLTLNDNTVNSSGGPATTFRYPAIYLSGIKADFELTSSAGSVARNHGSGNGLDAIVMHGEASQPLTWLTTGPTAPAAVPPVPGDHFGYVLDGGLTVDGALTTNTGDFVKVLGGAITVKGALTATGTTFTSAKDGLSIKLCDAVAGFDSVFIQRVVGVCPPAASGDWAGINVTGAATLITVTISFDDGLTVSGGSLQYAGGAMHDIAKNAIVVSGSPLSVTHVAFTNVAVDGIESTNSGSMDTITDDTFDHVAGVSINLVNSPADLRRNVFTNDGSPAVKTTGASVTVQCSSIQSGGLSGDSSLTVKESDFVPTVGVTAPAGATAENNWWGQGSGPSGQLSGGIAVTAYVATQNPTVTIAIAGLPSATQSLDDVRSDGSLGTGLVQATLLFSRNMNTDPVQPSVTYTSSPTPVAFSAASGWQTNDPRTWVGTAPITAPLTGIHTVSASGARGCVPDPQHNLMTPPTPKAFVADTATLPNVTVSAADLIGAGSARLHGHIDPNGWAIGASRFVLTNLALPFDQHSYATSVPANKTTAIDVTVMASGLTSGATYRVQLQVPSVNGTAVQPTGDTVTLTGAASQLLVTSPPPSAPVAGAMFSTTVTVTDGSAKVVSDFVGTVSVALTTPAGATLSGTLTKPVVNGVASFTDLSVNKTGTYTLTATSAPALPPATSSSFTVQPGAAAQLAFTQLPTNPKIGITMTPAVQVAIQDSLGNTVTGNTSTITISLASSNPPGGTLSGTLSKPAVAGVTSFDDLVIGQAGTYTFGATGGGFTASPSSSITVT